MTWAPRLGLTRENLVLVGAGMFVLALFVATSTRVGEMLPFVMLAALAAFVLVVMAFVSTPHVAVAATIPIYALLPAGKVLLFPWIGPVKDFIVLAAIASAGLTVLHAARRGRQIPGDIWTVALFAFLFLLYTLNLGGDLERDIAWAHGVRLFSEPLLLLLVGLTLPRPRRTLDWALKSLVATATVVAVVGILQQVVGASRLVEFGYEWDLNVRTINGFLRSFGTLDEPFAYAAFLVFGFIAVVMWMRRGPLAYAAGTIIMAGLALSVVRSAFVVAVGIFALWLARHGRSATAVFMLALVFVSTMVFVLSEDATEQRTVRGGPSLFFTVNGRTEAWRVVFDDPREVPLGKGVGEFGTAADRATFAVTRTAEEEEKQADEVVIVDSGYFATVANVGLVGLAALLLLMGRLVTLGRRAIARGKKSGWIAVSFLLALLLDAVTRESFTGFPTGFLGLLIVGIALAAAREEDGEKARGRGRKPTRARVPRPGGAAARHAPTLTRLL